MKELTQKIVLQATEMSFQPRYLNLNFVLSNTVFKCFANVQLSTWEINWRQMVWRVATHAFDVDVSCSSTLSLRQREKKNQ